MQELLDKVQKSPEVEQQLEEVEQAREDADLKARQIISIADKRLTAYSTVRKQSVLVNVVLDSVGKDKISVIKLVRTFTSLGLKESKELVDSAPITIMEAVSSKEAEGIQSRLEAAGAKVELEPVRIKK
ncbi:MAG: ribosomal protein L7/L12 [bacterium]|nr:ribosomal protein L7/L12 [bacterium]